MSYKPCVTIYSDGAFSNRHGGWGASLYCGDHDLHMAGYQYDTTNNRMELQAIIESLRVLTLPCEVHLFSDSKYALDGMTKYLPSWKSRNWRTTAGTPVANQDLWIELDRLLSIHSIHPHWVKGHNGNIGNEIADGLAQWVRKQPHM